MTLLDRAEILLTTTPGVVSDATFARFGCGGENILTRLRSERNLPVERVARLGYRLVRP